MTNNNIFQNLWDLAETFIKVVGDVWNWLNDDLIIKIPITIPYLFPDGITWDLGFAPIWLLGGGIVTLIGFWVIFK